MGPSNHANKLVFKIHNNGAQKSPQIVGCGDPAAILPQKDPFSIQIQLEDPEKRQRKVVFKFQRYLAANLPVKQGLVVLFAYEGPRKRPQKTQESKFIKTQLIYS